jgi:hypothetical protein
VPLAIDNGKLQKLLPLAEVKRVGLLRMLNPSRNEGPKQIPCPSTRATARTPASSSPHLTIGHLQQIHDRYVPGVVEGRQPPSTGFRQALIELLPCRPCYGPKERTGNLRLSAREIAGPASREEPNRASDSELSTLSARSRTPFMENCLLPTPDSQPPLCETCLERGRARPGTHKVGSGWMCDACFRGAGNKQEHSGDPRAGRDYDLLLARRRRYDPKRRARRHTKDADEEIDSREDRVIGSYDHSETSKLAAGR